MSDPRNHTLSEHDRDKAWSEDLLSLAEEARLLAEERLGLSAPAPVRLTTFGAPVDFHDYLGSTPRHVVAVARPSLREIVVLRPRWNGMNRTERRKVLLHEYVHLMIGHHVKGPLPDFLNEGLAMMVARDRGPGDSLRLNSAGTFGALIPLERLRSGIYQMEHKSLAYAQSLSVTQFIVERFSKDGGPGALIRALADPATGPNLIERFNSPAYLYTLEQQWKRGRRTLWTVLGALSGFSTLMVFASGMVMIAWWRKRRIATLKRERFAEEEELEQAIGIAPLPHEYGADPDFDIEEDFLFDEEEDEEGYR